MEAEAFASAASLVTLFACGSFIWSLLAKALCRLSGGEDDSGSRHCTNSWKQILLPLGEN